MWHVSAQPYLTPMSLFLSLSLRFRHTSDAGSSDLVLQYNTHEWVQGGGLHGLLGSKELVCLDSPQASEVQAAALLEQDLVYEDWSCVGSTVTWCSVCSRLVSKLCIRR